MKNVLLKAKSEFGLNTIVANISSNGNYTAVELDDYQTELYNAVIRKYYFADIGFDDIEQFIYRFTGVFLAENARYVHLLMLEAKNKGLFNELVTRSYSEDTTHNGSISKTGTEKLEGNSSQSDTTTYGKETTVNGRQENSGIDSESVNRSSEGSKSDTHSGTDTMQKGVTTTSQQTSTNEGEKLTRTSPNEELNVSGSTNTTVSDTGADTTIYGKKIETEESASGNESKTLTHGKTVEETNSVKDGGADSTSKSSTKEDTTTFDTTNTESSFGDKEITESVSHTRISVEDFVRYVASPSILEAFAGNFSKLFMGVFDI